MNIGFKKIEVPKEARLVVISDTDDSLEVMLPAPAEHVDEAPLTTSVAGPHLPELTETFLLAGKAVFTVSNPAGEHHTFKVRRVESEWPAGSGKMTVTYFVNAKTDVEIAQFGYIGILDIAKGTIKCTAKSMYVPGSKQYDVASWATQAVIGQKLIPAGYHIEHAGHCGKCGRTLTDPESIHRGIGPECWKVVGA